MIQRPVPREVTSMTSVPALLRRLNGNAAYWTRLAEVFRFESAIVFHTHAVLICFANPQGACCLRGWISYGGRTLWQIFRSPPVMYRAKPLMLREKCGETGGGIEPPVRCARGRLDRSLRQRTEPSAKRSRLPWISGSPGRVRRTSQNVSTPQTAGTAAGGSRR